MTEEHTGSNPLLDEIHEKMQAAENLIITALYPNFERSDRIVDRLVDIEKLVSKAILQAEGEDPEAEGLVFVVPENTEKVEIFLRPPLQTYQIEPGKPTIFPNNFMGDEHGKN